MAYQDWQNSTPLIEGIAANIMGLIQNNWPAIEKETTATNAVSKAILYMQDNLNELLDMKQVAKAMNIGYSIFRNRFKDVTEFSPAQYLM